MGRGTGGGYLNASMRQLGPKRPLQTWSVHFVIVYFEDIKSCFSSRSHTSDPFGQSVLLFAFGGAVSGTTFDEQVSCDALPEFSSLVFFFKIAHGGK